MRTFLLLLALGAAALAAPLEEVKEFPAGLKARLVRLRDAAMQSNYAYERLEYLCDQIGPRLSGSAQAAAAEQYVAAEMRKLGLKVTLEPCEVPHWVRGREEARILSPSHPLALTTLGGSVATPPEGITAEVVVAATFEELEKLDVKGKIVLLNHPYDERMAQAGQGVMAYAHAAPYRVDGPSVAGAMGAVACLVRSAGSGAYRLPHTGVLDYAADLPKIPAAALAVEDAELLARLSRKGPVQVHLVLTPETLPNAVGHNVIADLVGSERPNEVVIVSGHLDSWDVGTGALDDGCGVVMAMQALELVQRLGLKPRRTLRMVAWTNEENGLAGGKTYAANHRAKDHYGVIESDLGAGHPLGVAFQGDDKIGLVLAPMAEVLEPIGAPILRRTPYSAADIGPLVRQGVPGFYPIQDDRNYFVYHHTQADTLDKVDPLWLRENCAVMAVLAFTLCELR